MSQKKLNNKSKNQKKNSKAQDDFDENDLINSADEEDIKEFKSYQKIAKSTKPILTNQQFKKFKIEKADMEDEQYNDQDDGKFGGNKLRGEDEEENFEENDE